MRNLYFSDEARKGMSYKSPYMYGSYIIYAEMNFDGTYNCDTWGTIPTTNGVWMAVNDNPRTLYRMELGDIVEFDTMTTGYTFTSEFQDIPSGYCVEEEAYLGGKVYLLYTGTTPSLIDEVDPMFSSGFEFIEMSGDHYIIIDGLIIETQVTQPARFDRYGSWYERTEETANVKRYSSSEPGSFHLRKYICHRNYDNYVENIFFDEENCGDAGRYNTFNYSATTTENTVANQRNYCSEFVDTTPSPIQLCSDSIVPGVGYNRETGKVVYNYGYKEIKVEDVEDYMDEHEEPMPWSEAEMTEERYQRYVQGVEHGEYIPNMLINDNNSVVKKGFRVKESYDGFENDYVAFEIKGGPCGGTLTIAKKYIYGDEVPVQMENVIIVGYAGC